MAGDRPRPTRPSARERSAALRAARLARERRRRMLIWVAVVLGVAAVIGGVTVSVIASSVHHAKTRADASNSSAAAGALGPEGIALEEGTLLAPASTAATGEPVDGISCQAGEQVAYHIHTHLAVYVDGQPRAIPAGIGVVEPVPQQTANGVFMQASRCYYWLHAHAQDGVIHVEAPTQATHTLGQFFAIWRQPLTTNQVGPAHGAVTVYVNGKRSAVDPASIPLASHEDIQLDVGEPDVPPQSVDWSQSQL